MYTQKYNVAKSVGWRFVRGGIASAFGAMAAIVANMASQGTVGNLANLQVLGTMLAYAATVGFISGFVLAGDKYFRSQE